MKELTFSESIDIAADPLTVYSMVADVARMGEWSPVNTGGRWDDDSRGVGAWFTGHNETPERSWDTHCQVVADDPGREFAFRVGDARTFWGYTFEGTDAGVRVTESWQVPADSADAWEKRFGDDLEAEMQKRADAARTGIHDTLAALKAAAEHPAA